MQSGYRFIHLYEMLPTMTAHKRKWLEKKGFMKLPFFSSGSREICLRLVMALATHNATGWPAVYIHLSYLANIIASRGLPSYFGLYSYFSRTAEYSSSILQSVSLSVKDLWHLTISLVEILHSINKGTQALHLTQYHQEPAVTALYWLRTNKYQQFIGVLYWPSTQLHHVTHSWANWISIIIVHFFRIRTMETQPTHPWNL